MMMIMMTIKRITRQRTQRAQTALSEEDHYLTQSLSTRFVAA